MNADAKSFALRLPPDLYDRIRESATRNGRSINSEMIYLLDQGFAYPALKDDFLALEQSQPADDRTVAAIRQEMQRAFHSTRAELEQKYEAAAEAFRQSTDELRQRVAELEARQVKPKRGKQR